MQVYIQGYVLKVYGFKSMFDSNIVSALPKHILSFATSSKAKGCGSGPMN